MAPFGENQDSKRWHKHFAVEFNNRAWELTTLKRSTKKDHEMLNAAHASLLHWEAVGTEQNRMRAKMLLAEVHALLGYGSTAMGYAEETRDYFLKGETPDWEIALVHTVYAHATSAAGNADEYAKAHERAANAVEAIRDPKDRAIVRETFDQLPTP